MTAPKQPFQPLARVQQLPSGWSGKNPTPSALNLPSRNRVSSPTPSTVAIRHVKLSRYPMWFNLQQKELPSIWQLKNAQVSWGVSLFCFCNVISPFHQPSSNLTVCRPQPCSKGSGNDNAHNCSCLAPTAVWLVALTYDSYIKVCSSLLYKAVW